MVSCRCRMRSPFRGASRVLAERCNSVSGIALRSRSDACHHGERATDGRPSALPRCSLCADYAKAKGWQSLNFPNFASFPLLARRCSPRSKRKWRICLAWPSTTDTASPNALPIFRRPSWGAPHRHLRGQDSPRSGGSAGGPDGKAVARWRSRRTLGARSNVMKGYYRAPEETAAAVNPEGWFNTRDLVRLENGYLFIVGRTRELIIRFGEKCLSRRGRSRAELTPAVARSAVIAGRSRAPKAAGSRAYVQLAPFASASEATWRTRRTTPRPLQAGHRKFCWSGQCR